MANTKVTTRVIADDAITSDKLASGLTLGGVTTASGDITAQGNITLSSNANVIATRSLLARDVNGLNIGTTGATTALSIDNSANVTMPQSLTVSGTLTAALTGSLASATTATTQSASDNSTKVATTAYVTTAIANLVDSAPSALDTLNELAAALGDDANFSTTVTNSIATKAPLDSPVFSSTYTSGQDEALAEFRRDGGAVAAKVIYADASTDIEFGTTTSHAFSLITADTRRLTISNTGDATFTGDIIANKNLRLRTTDDQAQQWYFYTYTDDTLRINYNGAGADALIFDTSENATFSGTISSGAITSTAAVSADHYKFYQNSSASGATESIHRNTTGQITIRASSEDLVRVDGANEIVQLGGLPAGNVQTHGVVATNKVRATLGTAIGDTMRVFAVHGQTTNSDFLTFRARRITDGQSGWNHAVWDIARDVDNTSNLYEYLTFGIGELAVNDLSNNLDFRVESNTNSHALYVNGGNNSVGINSSNPDGALTVNGTPTSGDLIARFQHGTNGNNVKGVRINAPNASGTQAYADFAVDPETGNLGIGAGTSSGNLPIGKANMANAAIVITSPAGAAGAGEAIDFQPGESHTRTTVREQHHFGASDVYVQFRRFMYAASAFTNPTKNIITFTRSSNYPQACVYARVRQMGVSVNRAVIAEGFISVEKDSTASSWDVDYATMNNGTTGYSDTTNSFWHIARINTSAVPTWYTSISGDSITVGITMVRSTNYDRYIIETEVMTHQGMSYSWEA